VVHRFHPSLPAHELTAAAWVELLAGGVLDAEAYPDRAAAIISGCWAATRHRSALVGAAADPGCSTPVVQQLSHQGRW